MSPTQEWPKNGFDARICPAYTLLMPDIESILAQCEEFDWDADNAEKNFLKHNVTLHESEEVFFNCPVLLLSDREHSASEKRYNILGQTNAGRHLFIVFSIRQKHIRVISARDMTRKERQRYWQL